MFATRFAHTACYNPFAIYKLHCHPFFTSTKVIGPLTDGQFKTGAGENCFMVVW